MYGHDLIRFVGGKWNGTQRMVAPSTKNVGTGMDPLDTREDFRVGDLVECIDARDGIGEPCDHKVGGRYVVLEVSSLDIRVDDGGRKLAWMKERYKLIRRADEQTYSRKKLTLASGLLKYTEECFVLDGMSDSEARQILSKMNAQMPKEIETKALPCPKSSLVGGLAYDEKTGTLDVTFKPDKKEDEPSTYRYSNIGVGTLLALMSEKSPGQFYTKNIRGKYPCVQLG